MLQFGILGPLTVWEGDEEIKVRGRWPPVVLAALLLDVDRLVTVDRLIYAIYGEAPPQTARGQIQERISQLRRVLRPHGAEIETHTNGYRLRVPPQSVDVTVFQERCTAARAAVQQGRAREASRELHEALGLWRGQALAGLPGPVMEAAASRLEEMRVTAVEDRIDADLALGLHNELISELRAHVREHPLRERPRGQLMLALYRAGRQAEALEVYTATREAIAADLGADPGSDLQDLHHRMLNHDPSLDIQPTPSRAETRDGTVPAQLPMDIGTFVGRAAELRRIADIVGGDGPNRVIAIHGPGGMGKSALAVHAGHALADQFPDGQLYVNLHGATPGLTPLTSEEVLGRFLRALGVDVTQIPNNTDESAALFRTMTSGKRILVLLDNALDASQVRPMLPGGDTGIAIITSRAMLVTLDSTEHLPLDRLHDDEAVELLGRLAGRNRVSEDLPSARRLVELCSALPLAVRVAGARLAAHSSWTPSDLADRLATARNRLDELEHADLAIRASFAVSHHQLDADPRGRGAARLFELLGLLDVADFTPPVAAALADNTVVEAQENLNLLLQVKLIEDHASKRYRMHDLMRLYARERAELSLPDNVRTAVVRRALHCYLATARSISDQIGPHSDSRARVTTSVDLQASPPGVPLRSRQDVVTWVDGERENLIGVARQAAGFAETQEIAVVISAAISPAFEMCGWLQHQEMITLNAIQAAHRIGDLRGQAQAWGDLGHALQRQGRPAEATSAHEDALAAWRAAADRDGEASALTNLAISYKIEERSSDAKACYEAAIEANRALNDRSGEAIVLSNLATLHHQLGQFDRAINACEQSVAIYRTLGDALGEGIAVGNMAEAHSHAGRPGQAIPLFQQAIELVDQEGERYAVAEFCWELGNAYHQMGDEARAREHWRRALMVLEEVGAMSRDEAERIMAQPLPETPEAIRAQS